MQWSHTICSSVASVISYGWFTLQRATGPESSSENVCSVLYHFGDSGPRNIQAVRGLIWARCLGLFFKQRTMGFYQGHCLQNFKGRWVYKFRQGEGLCIHQIVRGIYHQCPSPAPKTKTKLWNHQTIGHLAVLIFFFFLYNRGGWFLYASRGLCNAVAYNWYDCAYQRE